MLVSFYRVTGRRVDFDAQKHAAPRRQLTFASLLPQPQSYENLLYSHTGAWSRHQRGHGGDSLLFLNGVGFGRRWPRRRYGQGKDAIVVMKEMAKGQMPYLVVKE
jgi:hypothetical protein